MFSLLRFTFVYNNLIPNKVLEGLAKIWFLPLNTPLRTQGFILSGSKLIITLDQGWLEFIGPQGLKSWVSLFQFKGDSVITFNVIKVLRIIFYLIVFILLLFY